MLCRDDSGGNVAPRKRRRPIGTTGAVREASRRSFGGERDRATTPRPATGSLAPLRARLRLGTLRKGDRGGATYVADRVHDLSLALAELRSRAAAREEVLRIFAQDLPELERALEPLYAALESLLAECCRADLEATFGYGDGSVAGLRRLAAAINALDRDVAAAEMLSEQREHLRTVVRWARRVREVPAVYRAPRGISAAGLDDDGHLQAPSDAQAARDESADDATATALEEGCRDWTISIFPRYSLQSRHSSGSGSGSGTGVILQDGDNLGGRPRRPLRVGAGDDILPPPIAPVLAVQALLVVLPPVEAPAEPESHATRVQRTGSGRSSGGGGGGGGSGYSLGRWLTFPFSWLMRARAADQDDPRESAPAATPPPATLPTVVVRVLFGGQAPDLARLARAEEKLSLSSGTGDNEARATGTPAQDGKSHTIPDTGGVRLVKSEVRVRDTGDAARACQLQIVLELRTSSPVIVASLSHSGGSFRRSASTPATSLRTPSCPALAEATAVDANAIEGTTSAKERIVEGGARAVSRGASREDVGGADTRDTSPHRKAFVAPRDSDGNGGERVGNGVERGFRDAADEDFIRTGWTQAPPELLPPPGVGKGESEVKAGKEHIVGVTVSLPLGEELSLAEAHATSPPYPSSPLEERRNSRPRCRTPRVNLNASNSVISTHQSGAKLGRTAGQLVERGAVQRSPRLASASGRKRRRSEEEGDWGGGGGGDTPGTVSRQRHESGKCRSSSRGGGPTAVQATGRRFDLAHDEDHHQIVPAGAPSVATATDAGEGTEDKARDIKRRRTEQVRAGGWGSFFPLWSRIADNSAHDALMFRRAVPCGVETGEKAVVGSVRASSTDGDVGGASRCASSPRMRGLPPRAGSPTAIAGPPEGTDDRDCGPDDRATCAATDACATAISPERLPLVVTIVLVPPTIFLPAGVGLR